LLKTAATAIETTEAVARQTLEPALVEPVEALRRAIRPKYFNAVSNEASPSRIRQSK
jgi:hypothetical protein